MAGINKVILVGNLGADPEVRYTSGGTAVANFTMATSESWKDKNSGEKKQKTEWHRIVIWGAQAEVAGQYLNKGRQIYLEGKLQTRKWQDNNGTDRYVTEIVASHFLMVGGRRDSQGNQNPTPNQNQKPNNQNNGYDGGYSGFPNMDDDIPF